MIRCLTTKFVNISNGWTGVQYKSFFYRFCLFHCCFLHSNKYYWFYLIWFVNGDSIHKADGNSMHSMLHLSPFFLLKILMFLCRQNSLSTLNNVAFLRFFKYFNWDGGVDQQNIDQVLFSAYGLRISTLLDSIRGPSVSGPSTLNFVLLKD